MAVVCAVSALTLSARQAPAPLPIGEVRPGMVGIGRSVFAGETIEEFRANILGVLKNVMGPNRDLILAKLEGGPLASTGVIQGMSGSPVYVDGRLIGAVSYALGSFPREPFAGITPFAEMSAAVDGAAGPRTGAGLSLQWPATPDAVFGALRRVAERAAAPLGNLGMMTAHGFDVSGPASLADMARALKPIGAAMVLGGFDPELDSQLRQALAPAGGSVQTPARPARASAALPTLRPGDPFGVSLIRGDLEMGATGTVTQVDGTRVYGFGHPFLNLGPTSFAMTSAHVFAVLPSLDSSLKIATLGPVIGTISQDRATAVGGTLGPGPRELAATITLSSDRAPDQRFAFDILQDPTLTPLFAYVAVLNSLASYERQNGPMTIAISGSVSYGADGRALIDDVLTGDGTLGLAAAAATAPLGVAAANEFRAVTPETFDLHLTITEKTQATTIERAWLDTTKPAFGSTVNLQVLLRDYRGGAETVSIPVTMPMQATGPLTLLVSDAPTLSGLEQRELKPGRPTSLAELMAQLNATRRNNRLYVRLLASNSGAVIGGESLPALPSAVRSVLDSDKSVSSAPLSRNVIGAWERRFDRAVRGSRELTITLRSGQ